MDLWERLRGSASSRWPTAVMIGSGALAATVPSVPTSALPIMTPVDPV